MSQEEEQGIGIQRNIGTNTQEQGSRAQLQLEGIKPLDSASCVISRALRPVTPISWLRDEAITLEKTSYGQMMKKEMQN